VASDRLNTLDASLSVLPGTGNCGDTRERRGGEGRGGLAAVGAMKLAM
jgi:hypothetical protein